MECNTKEKNNLGCSNLVYMYLDMYKLQFTHMLYFLLPQTLDKSHLNNFNTERNKLFNSRSSVSLFWETRLGKVRIPDRSTDPYPTPNREQTLAG